MTELVEAKTRVGAWVEQIRTAGADKKAADLRADQESLERAADLEAIYQDMSWVDEMPPVKKKRLGRRVDPKGREQFAKWVKQTYGWGTKQHLNRLKTSMELVGILSPAGDGIRPTGERALRPLAKLRDQGYGDHQAEVWQEAVDAAFGMAPTEAQVRKAVNAFLERHKPPVKNVAIDPRTREEIRAARKAKLLAEFDSLLEEENRTASDLLDEMIRHFDTHQHVLAKERAS